MSTLHAWLGFARTACTLLWFAVAAWVIADATRVWRADRGR